MRYEATVHIVRPNDAGFWAQRYDGADCHNANGAECYAFGLQVAVVVTLVLLMLSAGIAAVCAVPGRWLSARGASDTTPP